MLLGIAPDIGKYLSPCLSGLKRAACDITGVQRTASIVEGIQDEQ